MKGQGKNQSQPELFWGRLIMRKWLNINNRQSDYSADPDDDEEDDEDLNSETKKLPQGTKSSRFRDGGDDDEVDSNDAIPRSRRRKSETFRAQYINNKELRICVGTWNVGGKLPHDDLDIDDWLDTKEPADIYVLGFQEIVPLNAGNIFGSEDRRPVPKWESIIRETLNRIQHTNKKMKSFSDPPSPSKFKPSDDIPDIEEEVLLESDSDIGEEVHPLDVLDEEFDSLDITRNESVASEKMFTNSGVSVCSDSIKIGKLEEQDLQRQFSSPKRLNRLHCFREEDSEGDMEASSVPYNGRLTKLLSGTERIGLSWPEPPLHLLPQHTLDRPTSFKSYRSFKAPNSFRAYNSFKPMSNEAQSEIASLAETDLDALMNRKRKSSYVRIVSKQMVGIFLSVWVRKSLRKHVQNINVSTIGVGVMGYIGNKGSVSVRMSIYQTLFCFICTHLTAGEKDADKLKRNADVHEIHRRTQFYSVSDIALPKSIHDHEKLIWFGDLNYRLNLPYEKARESIKNNEWSKLFERDQLAQELKKGRAFDGWNEGILDFPPTYKYEMNSDKYIGEDPKFGRRTPAWCDRILSYGKGIRLLSYRRTELKLSDHRPVTATYMAEVEEFSHKKLQRALTFTDAEMENQDYQLPI